MLHQSTGGDELISLLLVVEPYPAPLKSMWHYINSIIIIIIIGVQDIPLSLYDPDLQLLSQP